MRSGRAWWLAGAYATLLAVVTGGLVYGDRLDRRVAGVAGPPLWLLLPFGLLLCLAGSHALVEQRRVGAALDAYHDEYFVHQPHIDGVTQVVVCGVFVVGLGATLALVGTFFGLVGLAQSLR